MLVILYALCPAIVSLSAARRQALVVVVGMRSTESPKSPAAADGRRTTAPATQFPHPATRASVPRRRKSQHDHHLHMHCGQAVLAGCQESPDPHRCRGRRRRGGRWRYDGVCKRPWPQGWIFYWRQNDHMPLTMAHHNGRVCINCQTKKTGPGFFPLVAWCAKTVLQSVVTEPLSACVGKLHVFHDKVARQEFFW